MLYVPRRVICCIFPSERQLEQKKIKQKTYSTRDSPVVTHPSTSLAITCLSMGERTGSRVLRCLWPYVPLEVSSSVYVCLQRTLCQNSTASLALVTAGRRCRQTEWTYLLRESPHRIRKKKMEQGGRTRGGQNKVDVTISSPVSGTYHSSALSGQLQNVWEEPTGEQDIRKRYAPHRAEGSRVVLVEPRCGPQYSCLLV